MPRRRTEDAVRVVMTDHFIQRVRPGRDLTAPRLEAATLAAKHYPGEVALYYPAALPHVLGGEIEYPDTHLSEGLRLYRDLMETGPDELTMMAYVRAGYLHITVCAIGTTNTPSERSMLCRRRSRSLGIDSV